MLVAAGHATPPRLAARLEAMQAGGAVLLAMEWGPPSGIVAVRWFATLLGERPSAEITALLVSVDARRRGIGRLLVKAASQAARVAGCGTIEVAVREGQSGLDLFCSATGFSPDGLRVVRSLRKTG